MRQEVLDNMDYKACLALASAVIKAAVEDFATLYADGNFHREFGSAKAFIFGDNGEEFIKRCGLQDDWDIEYVRRKAIEMRRYNGHSDFLDL